jgi:hypothetical protein
VKKVVLVTNGLKRKFSRKQKFLQKFSRKRKFLRKTFAKTKIFMKTFAETKIFAQNFRENKNFCAKLLTKTKTFAKTKILQKLAYFRMIFDFRENEKTRFRFNPNMTAQFFNLVHSRCRNNIRCMKKSKYKQNRI